MIYVNAMPWQQVGNDLQAAVLCDFALDTDYSITIGGSIGGDYFEAQSVDMDASTLTAPASVTATFNGVPRTVAAGSFRTYALAPHQRVITLHATAGAPNTLLLTFYPKARPEWR